MIRITLNRRKRVGGVVYRMVREFGDEYDAAKWLVEDSYFAEPYTVSMTWERLDDEEPA